METENRKHIAQPEPKPVLCEALVGLQSLQAQIMEDFSKNVLRKFDNHLKDYLKNNLLQFGYKFDNDDEFINFSKDRITRVCYSENRNYYEFYLDFKDKENKKMVGCYSDEIEFINEGNKYTAIIGKSFA